MKIEERARVLNERRRPGMDAFGVEVRKRVECSRKADCAFEHAGETIGLRVAQIGAAAAAQIDRGRGRWRTAMAGSALGFGNGDGHIKSDERSVGNRIVRTGRYRWSPYD